MVEIKEEFKKRLEKALELADMKPVDLARVTGISEATISQYRSGYSKPKDKRLVDIANALRVNPAWLMGVDVPMRGDTDTITINIGQISKRRFPVLGEIACGVPRLMQENVELYVDVKTEIKADFVLYAKGDSMTGARINDGDIVFVRQQPTVENGEIAAVAINDEATPKRFFYYADRALLILRAENPDYEDQIYQGDELSQVRVLGKAVAFQSDVR